MASEGNIDATAQAIDWHLRQRDLDEAGWTAFVAWLEVPANGAAYDRVAAADRTLADVAIPAIPVPLPLAANDDIPPPRRAMRWGWSVGGVGIAAALALTLLPILRSPNGGRTWIETKAGESRAVALADGTRVDLDGGSRLGIDPSDPRVAVLDRGEAVFHVTHDAAHPFSVRSGALTVEDVGTVFDVVRFGPRMDVSVAEGGVVVEPAGAHVALSAGQAVSVREDTRRMVRSDVAADLVGGWRGGRLAFTDASLGDVAAAVERRYGTRIALQSGLSAQPFTGMIALSGSAGRDIPHLAALVGAEWRQEGERWILVPTGGATR